MTDYTVFDIETTGRNPWSSKLLCAGVGDRAYHGAAATRAMRKLFATPGVIVEHTMFDARWAMLEGIVLGDETEIHDTRTMAWLLEEEVPGDPQPFKLETLMKRWLGEDIVKPLRKRAGLIVWDCDVQPVRGLSGVVPVTDVPLDVLEAYCVLDLAETARLYERLRDELDEQQLWDLYLDREVELGITLVASVARGLPFDLKTSEKLREMVLREADELRAMLVDIGGVPGLNLGAPGQVSDLLFTPKGERVAVKASLRLTDEQAATLKATPKDERLDVARSRSFGLPPTFEVERVGRDYVHGFNVGTGLGLKIGETGVGQGSGWKQKQKEHAKPTTSSTAIVLANPDSDFVADLVYWRELDKLGSSFLARFPEYVHDGRLYGNMNRSGTATGRFSSSEPNLQNFPAHGSYGALIRALFRGKLALGDYGQLEQRVATHFSQDPVLLQAYADGIDVYALAAATLFGGEPVKKHPKRGLMKTGMLAIQYGARAGKLAQLLLLDGHKMDDGSEPTTEDGQQLIDQLHNVFPVFFEWRLDVIAQAIFDGYVETLEGRRRRLVFPDGWLGFFEARRLADAGDKKAKARQRAMRSRFTEDELARGFAMERQAINAKCQGSAADVVGGAMVAVEHEMPDEVATLVQVHDEFVWERLSGWNRGSLAKLRDLCENGHGYELDVPLVFEAQLAKSWADKGATANNASQLLADRTARDRVARDNKSESVSSRKASQLGDDSARAQRLEEYRRRKEQA